MKFVSIVGKLDHFDKFVSNYIIDSNLHPENAQNIITLVRGIMPFPNAESKDDSMLKSCVALLDLIHLDYSPEKLEPYAYRNFMQPDVIERSLSEINEVIRANRDEQNIASARLRDCMLMKESLENIINVNVNVEEFFNLEFVKFRFGRIPKEALRPLVLLADEHDMIMIPLSSDENYC